MVLCSCRSPVVPFQPAVPQGGRAVAIAVDQSNAQHIIVASESGGAFSTSNAGATWNHLDSLPTFGVNDLEFSPDNPAVVIASSGTGYQATGHGIWRSSDGGNTWQQPSGAMPPSSRGCDPHVGATAVSFQPGSSNVFVGTDCGLAVSNSLGATNSWNYVSLDPTVPHDFINAVLALAGGQVYVAAQSGFWHSADGVNWFRAVTPPTSAPGSNHAFAASPFNATHAFIATQPFQLSLTTDGGVNWTPVTAPNVRVNRPAFIRAAKTPSGAANHFDLFFGDGVNISRQTFVDSPNPTGAGWIGLAVDHSDPADVGFDNSGNPILLATDGGVHKTNDNGLSWTLTGGGAGGFNALQITEVTGTVVGSDASSHEDLYYGTQDNDVVASPDGGSTWPVHAQHEGFHLRVVGTSPDHSGIKVTGVTCFGCGDRIWDAHLANQQDWCDAPCQSAAQFPNLKSDNSPPFLMQSGVYLQPAWDSSGATHYMLSSDFGAHWSDSFTVVPQPAGPPQIAGPPANPTIYLAVNRGCCTTSGQPIIGLLRIQNVLGPGTVMISNADSPGSGFGSLGFFPTMWVWYPVFGSSRIDSLYLIIADLQNQQMRFSLDGGVNWHGDAQLTNLVVANGVFDFSEGQNMLVHNISFDPFAACDILVGTGQNGLFQSNSGGRNWKAVDHSVQIGNMSWFYFPTLGRPIVASSYGSGLWQLNVQRTTSCPNLPNIPNEHYAPSTIVDPRSGVHIPFTDIGNPEVCGVCQYIVVKNGRITDLQLNGTQVTKISMSGGAIYEFDVHKNEVPLRIPNVYSVVMGTFGGDSLLQSLTKGTTWIRGLVVQGDTLRGIIVSGTELPFRPSRFPYVRVEGTEKSAGPVSVPAGGTVVLLGEGFAMTTTGGTAVRVLIAPESSHVTARIIEQSAVVAKDGTFAIQMHAPATIGVYDILVEQQQGKRLSMTKANLLVVPTDRSASEQNEPEKRR
jgi:photosystem II stability/assembly factor-like uncharacterized protein